MKVSNITIVFTLIFIVNTSAFGQGMRKKYADKEFANLNYYYASEGYEDVLERTGDSSLIAGELSKSYLMIGDVKKAIEWYEYINKNEGLTIEQLIELGLLYREIKKYSLSDQIFNKLSANEKNNSVVRNYTASKESFNEIKQTSENFEVTKCQLSTSASDFSVAYGDADELFITNSKRTKLPIERKHGWTGDYFYSIYSQQGNDDPSLIRGEINSKHNDAYVAFDSINEYIYFTRNNPSIKGTNESNLIICRGKYVNKKIVNVLRLTFNDKNYSCAFPTISSDGSSLYFSSDMPGGFGGMDIYRVSVYDDGTVSQPENLGPKINTTMDEITPHIKDKEGVLFFSSKGHLGLGGFDVFAAKLSINGDIKEVQNLKPPINSEKDDLSFVNNKYQSSGYLVSNRFGNDDVFQFKQLKIITSGIIAKGSVISELTNNIIHDVHVIAKDTSGNILNETKTKENGSYKLDLGNYQGDYKLELKKPTYQSKNYSIDKNNDQEQNLSLNPILEYNFKGSVKNKETKQTLPEVTIYLIDSKTKDTILTTISDSSGKINSETIEREFNTSYQYDLIIEKDGYITKREEFSGTFGKETTTDLNKLLKMEITEIDEGKTDLGIIANVDPIYFDLNSAEIRDDAAKELDKIYTVLKDNPNIKMELRSHTDIRGDREYNLLLSQKRATSSIKYLIDKGIKPSRLKAKGMGEENPIISQQEINSAKNEEAKEKLHQLNRRTEFIVVD